MRAASLRAQGCFLCGILLLFSGVPLPEPVVALPQATTSPYVISRQVALVLVPVTVRDAKGRFVSGLRESDFRLYQDGKLQNISVFRSEDIPVTAGLVVDHSGSMRSKNSDVMAGALAFVRASNPEGKGFVVNFSDEPVFGLPNDVPFSSNLDQLQEALRDFGTGGTTALYDALFAALQHIQNDETGKKVLLLISDGGDDASKHDFAQVLRLAQSSNTIIYTIGLFDEESANQNPGVLRKLARATGGESFFPTSTGEVVSICTNIAADIRHQYNLAYSPMENERRGYHRIRVTIQPAGHGKLFVRSRDGYFFPSQPANRTTIQ